MTTNEGEGFLRFQARLDAITEAIGEPTLRPAIAKHFSACLEAEMRAARGLGSWGGLPWGVFWTMATTAEFNAATDRAEATLRAPRAAFTLPVIAEASWRGTKLYLRGTRIYAERLGYRLSAFTCFEGSPRYDRKLGRDATQWQVCADKEFLDCAGVGLGGSSPQTTHAKSEAAGVKAIRRMAKDFLGVTMVDL